MRLSHGLLASWLTTALLTAASGIARADSPAEKLAAPEARVHRSGEILERAQRPTPEELGLTDRISLHRKSGLQYQESFRWRGRDFEVRLRGPVHKNLQRRQVGLKFEIRF